jgi:hypothetical protein
MHRELSGAVADSGSRPGVGARVWWPTIRVRRENPSGGELPEENVTVHLGDWFNSVPWENHRVEVSGEWKEAKRYLEVTEFKDLDAGASFRRDSGKLSKIPGVEGDVGEFMDLSFQSETSHSTVTAFAFTFTGDTCRSVAFRGSSNTGPPAVPKGTRVRVTGLQDAGSVITPKTIEFPRDPSMQTWAARRWSPVAVIAAGILLLAFAAFPWLVGFSLTLDATSWLIQVVWSAICLGLFVVVAVLATRRWHDAMRGRVQS